VIGSIRTGVGTQPAPSPNPNDGVRDTVSEFDATAATPRSAESARGAGPRTPDRGACAAPDINRVAAALSIRMNVASAVAVRAGRRLSRPISDAALDFWAACGIQSHSV
jgi:hypothetical protein